MNLKVKVNNNIYDVHVGNVSERPILVTIEDQVIEVWPEQEITLTQPQSSQMKLHQTSAGSEIHSSSPTQSRMSDKPASDTGDKAKFRSVRAPIPGVITSINVEPGSEVTIGQELCKLEAMKMNNSIRANHAGIISLVNISIGQHVKHNDTLMEFAE